ncbi:MAG: hypothetical protein SP4CHLAM5_00890 [Chlamydiia bacterium]|nr:hypothetical protein [Chlamydiia bacterium]MCH9623709.1 hypothetical protein [Chlamydiia bacterium]
MISIKATIFFERLFWVATFERTDKEGYAIARHIFGGEPSDQEVYEFVLKETLKNEQFYNLPDFLSILFFVAPHPYRDAAYSKIKFISKNLKRF